MSEPTNSKLTLSPTKAIEEGSFGGEYERHWAFIPPVKPSLCWDAGRSSDRRVVVSALARMGYGRIRAIPIPCSDGCILTSLDFLPRLMTSIGGLVMENG